MTDVPIYRVRPQIGGGGCLYVPDAPNNREGPQAREPSKCLNRQSYGERSPATKGSKKDYDRAITLAAEAVHVPAHLAPPGSLQAKQLRHLHAQLSLGQSCHRQKNVLLLCTQDCLGRVQLCDPVDCGPPGFSVREECCPGKNTGGYWTLLVAIPFQSTVFPAALATNPLEYLVMREPL